MRFLLIFALCASFASAASAQQLTPRIAQMIGYLPPQSETLAVDQKERFISGEEMRAPGEEFVLPANLQIPFIGPALAGRTIEVSMEARSGFWKPKGLGMMPYNGSGLILLKPLAGQSRDDLKQLAWKNAKQKLTLVGQEVAVVEEKREEEKGEQDLWRGYVAVPRPNLIVLATDRASMITTLARMQRPNLSDRAIPASWSGWKLVDTTAPFWAVRRLDLPGNTSISATLDDDPNPKALVVYQRVQADKKSDWVIKYDGNQKVALPFFNHVKRETKGTLTQPAGTSISQLTVSDPNGYFTFYALGLLGPGILL